MSGQVTTGAIRPRTAGWWRVHRAVVRHWMAVAFVSAPHGFALKTDLFDEASGSFHHASDVPGHLRFLGVDIDRSVTARAAVRLRAEDRESPCLVADIRHSPFSSESVAAVLSLSTLDHFESRGEIRLALKEIYRVLMPGGTLLLTLDNPVNPEVALRAQLPPPVVKRLRADTFPIGSTLSSRAGSRLLADVGFRVQRRFYLGHAPRYLGIRLMGFLANHAPAAWSRAAEALALNAERLSRTPLAMFTGHFVGWVAVKPSPEALRV